MTRKTIVVIAAIAAGLLAANAVADAKPRKWRVPRASATYLEPGAFSQGPARMIEIKPGLYVSTYGCVTDEGNGRYLPCGAGRSN